MLLSGPALAADLDLRAFGAKGDGRTDDSAALAASVRAANQAAGEGFPACIHVPAGRYRITTPPPMFAGAGCVLGEGRWQSIFQLDAAFAGDLFAWSESWGGGAVLDTRLAPDYAHLRIGARVASLTIAGDRAATGRQNGLVFYDRDDFISLDDLDLFYLNGRAIYSGVPRRAKVAYLRESRLSRLRVWTSGSPGVPAVEFASTCAQPDCKGVDASNEVDIDDLDIYGSWGPSLVFRNDNTNIPLRQFRIAHLRIEGAEGNPNHDPPGTDLLTIGDATQPGLVVLLTFESAEFISPYGGGAAIHLLSPPGCALRCAPRAITFRDAYIGRGAGAGKGLWIESGHDLRFSFTGLSSEATNVTLGPGAAAPVVLDGTGMERWSYSIDPASQGVVKGK